MADSSPPRRLTALDATLLVMGGIVGVGIFFTPQTVAERVHEPWAFLAVWAFGGAIALCAALTFAELGASFPRAGGWFVFLREAYGPFPAYLFAWVVLFVVSTGAAAAIAGFCASMAHDLVPRAVGPPGSASHTGFAAALLIALTGLTLRGMRRAALLQNACMVVKVAALLALVVLGLALAPDAPPVVLEPAAGPVRGVIGGMVAALLPVFFSYGGWQMICYVAPEVDRPERTLPRAILIGVLGVVALYLLANAAFLHVLGLEGVAAHGDFAARLAERTAGPLGRRLLAAGMGISALGICAVIVIATPWLYVAMARERLFFAGFGRLHPRTGAPVLALLVQAAVALLYLVFGTLQSLVDSVVFVEWIFHGLVALALILLRVRRPDLPRPYASPLFPLAPAIYLLAALLVVGGSLWQAERRPVVTGLAIVALGALLYVPWRRLLARVERKRGVDLP